VEARGIRLRDSVKVELIKLSMLICCRTLFKVGWAYHFFLLVLILNQASLHIVKIELPNRDLLDIRLSP